VHKATLHPKFNETFIVNGVYEKDLRLLKLEILLWDWNRLSEHKLLCHYTLSLSELIITTQSNITSMTTSETHDLSEKEVIEQNEMSASWYALQCPPWVSEKKHWLGRKPFRKEAHKESQKNKWEEERNERKRHHQEKILNESMEKLEKEQQKVSRIRSSMATPALDMRVRSASPTPKSGGALSSPPRTGQIMMLD